MVNVAAELSVSPQSAWIWYSCKMAELAKMSECSCGTLYIYGWTFPPEHFFFLFQTTIGALTLANRLALATWRCRKVYWMRERRGNVWAELSQLTHLVRKYWVSLVVPLGICKHSYNISILPLISILSYVASLQMGTFGVLRLLLRYSICKQQQIESMTLRV